MGSIAAMNSINRVMEKHGDEICRKWLDSVRESNPLVEDVEIEGGLYKIHVMWVLQDGSRLPGPDIDIDTLAEEYPDCEVGY